MISFDFIMLIVIAALIAGIGLYENSPVIVVASMLISPMMCPVLAAVVGTMVGKRDLLYQGLPIVCLLWKKNCIGQSFLGSTRTMCFKEAPSGVFLRCPLFEQFRSPIKHGALSRPGGGKWFI